jgi:carbonic anhydrase
MGKSFINMNHTTAGFAIVSILMLVGCASLKTNTSSTQHNALERLQVGNDRFITQHMRHPDQSTTRVKETFAGQNPFAVIITCSDSRVPPEIIFDEGIGDLFVIRNAGNIIDEEDVLASVEYAVEHLHVHTILVMGHEHCGAIEAMTHGQNAHEPTHINAIIQRIRAETEVDEILQKGSDEPTLVHQCVNANVLHGVKALSQQIESLQAPEAKNRIEIIGAVYDIQTGKVHFHLPLDATH